MERIKENLAILISLLMLCTIAIGNTARQTVTYRIDAINEISINGNETLFIVGGDSIRYADVAVTTNEDNMKITGSVSIEVPAYPEAELYVRLDTPAGASSMGCVIMTEEPRDLIINISRIVSKDLNLTYIFMKDNVPMFVEEFQRNLILTLINGD